MATPDGCIDASDGGWPVALRVAGVATYIPFDLVNHKQHPAWFESGGTRMRASLYWQETVPAGSTLTLQPGAWFTVGSEHDSVGADVGTWEEMTGLGDIRPRHVTGSAEYPGHYNCYSSGWGTVSQQVKHSPTRFRVRTSADTCEVLAFGIETEFQLDFDESTPPGSGAVEHIGRNTDADSWRPYDKNEPVSAWEGQEIVSKTFNKILYKSVQVWSVPL